MSPDAPPVAGRQRHVIVLLGLTALAVVGMTLVVTGRTSGQHATSTTAAAVAATTVAPVPLRYLGTFASNEVLRNALRHFDPLTLQLSTGAPSGPTAPTSTLVPLPSVTDQSFRRCLQGLTDTNGSPLGAVIRMASAKVAGSAVLVATFHLAATTATSGSNTSTTAPPSSPRHLRAIVADPLTCVIRFAIDY